VARAGLALARAGYIAAEERRYLGILSHARVGTAASAPLRQALLENVLAQVGLPKSPTGPRALQLYTTLLENAEYLAAHRVPADGTDVTGDDGAVYRFFGGHGLEFHPLANGSKLNALVAAGDTAGARALVAALSARALPQANGSAVWEYRFNFGSQADPWTSGMAQAVLAQALARAGAVDLARRAYLAIPGLLDRQLASGGTWIKLYSGSRLVVLNATASAHPRSPTTPRSRATPARRHTPTAARGGEAEARALRHGHWSRFLGEGVDPALPGLRDLALKLLEADLRPDLTSMAGRFELYETEPPLMTGTTSPGSSIRSPRTASATTSTFASSSRSPRRSALVVDGEAVDGYTWHGATPSAGRRGRCLPASTPRGSSPAAPTATPAPPTSAPSRSRATARRRSSPPTRQRPRLLAREGRRERLLPHPVLLSRNGEHKLLTPTRASGAATFRRATGA
jgi:hypothetical protein